MKLKEWNKLQVNIFKLFDLKDPFSVYKIAALIAQFKHLPNTESVAREVINEVECFLKDNKI